MSLNDAEVLAYADAPFIIVENLFCSLGLWAANGEHKSQHDWKMFIKQARGLEVSLFYFMFLK